MTDDRIIINGVNVIQCRHLIREVEEDSRYYWFCNMAPTGCAEDCINFKDCYYKQLARKTAECEKLKERLERTENDLKYQCVDCMNVKSDRYRKALKEIEWYCNNQIRPDCSFSGCT